MRKPLRDHILRATGLLLLIGFTGACTTPVAPESARTRTSGPGAAFTAVAEADTTDLGADGSSGTAAADSVAARGGGFIGSGH
jgi:hypothetical protein